MKEKCLTFRDDPEYYKKGESAEAWSSRMKQESDELVRRLATRTVKDVEGAMELCSNEVVIVLAQALFTAMNAFNDSADRTQKERDLHMAEGVGVVQWAMARVHASGWDADAPLLAMLGMPHNCLFPEEESKVQNAPTTRTMQ